jgi:hypothetical protein
MRSQDPRDTFGEDLPHGGRELGERGVVEAQFGFGQRGHDRAPTGSIALAASSVRVWPPRNCSSTATRSWPLMPA